VQVHAIVGISLTDGSIGFSRLFVVVRSLWTLLSIGILQELLFWLDNVAFLEV